jgi:preprotein translocase subunit SecG
MEIKTALNIIEIVIGVVLTILIVLQQQGSGLGTLFGNVGGESYRTKRGAEKLFFNMTIVFIVLFVVNGLAIAILNANTK